jgi:hypothetical protein
MTSIDDFTLNVKVWVFGNILQLQTRRLDELPRLRKLVSSCEVCGRRAEMERVEGYAFEMCPHCAYMTRMHAVESHDPYST